MLMNLEETPEPGPPFLYGTIACGADTWRNALGRGHQIFSYDSRLRSADPKHRTNYHRTNWNKYPSLNLLVVQENTNSKINQLWMKDWGFPHRATHLLVFHGNQTITHQLGNTYKAWCKCVRGRGYDTTTWHMDSVKCGASLWSSYLVTFCYPKNSKLRPPLFLDSEKIIRPCCNTIRTYNISKSQYHPISKLVPGTHPMQANYVGSLYHQPVYSWEGPSCGQKEKSWILVPGHGIRRVQHDELGKLKGLQESMYTNLTQSVLFSSIEQHIWACLGKNISPFLLNLPSIHLPLPR